MFPDSFGRLVVGYAGQKASVVLDLPVEFNALVTHRHFRIRANLPQKNPNGPPRRPQHGSISGTQDESRIGVAAGPNAE